MKAKQEEASIAGAGRKMKDSGIAWLGEVPAEWECTKLKYLVVKSNGGAWGEDSPDNKSGAICLRVADFDCQRGRFRPCDKDELTHRIYDEAHFARLALQKGDIIIEKSGGGAKTPVGRAVLYDGEWGPVAYSNFTQRLRFDASKVTSQFIAYWLRTWYAHRLSPFYIKQTTGIQNLNVPLMLAKERIFLPPLPEQDAIARHLDGKTSKIDRLLDARRKEVAALKELKQAAVEEQLHAYPVKSKTKLKYIGRFFRGRGASRDNLVEEKVYPCILYGDIYTQYEYKTSAIAHYIDGAAYSAARKISKGDIVMAGTGETKAEIGKPILYMGDEVVAVGGDAIVFRPYKGINAEYLLYQLYSQAALEHRYVSGKGDIIVHIYPRTLGNTIISFPEEKDQMAAVAKIDKTIAQANKAIAAYTKEIALLEELKAAIIAEGVRGNLAGSWQL